MVNLGGYRAPFMSGAKDTMSSPTSREEKKLARAMERGARALADAGLTVEDLLADLPSTRTELLQRWYGEEFASTLECVERELCESDER